MESSKILKLIGKLIITFLIIWLGIALIGFLGVLIYCTTGGASIIVIPVVILLSLPFLKLIISVWGGKSSEQLKQNDLPKEQVAIMNYIAQARAAGSTSAEIKKNLLDNGWGADEINRILN